MKTGSLVEILMDNRAAFKPVVRFNPETDKLAGLDLTAANKRLSKAILGDIASFGAWINFQMEQTGARYAIGGYAEHRTVYANSRVFDAAAPGGEPRRLHLGVDIWGKPHTPVMAPYGGIVHSFAFNDRPGDYGATIILTHQLNGVSFHTLYGHLSLNSIKALREGESIEAGDVFADFGIPAENGQWPPHLHFQVIKEIGDYRGDYPGVCALSGKDHYLNNCPDPDLILQLNQYVSPVPE